MIRLSKEQVISLHKRLIEVTGGSDGIRDYGHVDDKTPSLAISLLKDNRNYGIGTRLMKQMLTTLRSQGYHQVSLSVQKMNYAVHMYKKVGFEIVGENEEEYIMICKL